MTASDEAEAGIGSEGVEAAIETDEAVREEIGRRDEVTAAIAVAEHGTGTVGGENIGLQTQVFILSSRYVDSV